MPVAYSVEIKRLVQTFPYFSSLKQKFPNMFDTADILIFYLHQRLSPYRKLYLLPGSITTHHFTTFQQATQWISRGKYSSVYQNDFINSAKLKSDAMGYIE